MRNYKGYYYKKIDYDFYQLYNENGEKEVECVDLNELKKIVDTREQLGYWAY